MPPCAGFAAGALSPPHSVEAASTQRPTGPYAHAERIAHSKNVAARAAENSPGEKIQDRRWHGTLRGPAQTVSCPAMSSAHGPTRHIGLPSGIALVVSNMVGAGVFLSAGYMAQDMGPGAILLAWLVGAATAIAG